ncbi:MAG TPA: twin-arginine translocase TatA/TatE family subunit [Anaerolineales bacterium]|nr:twin-arginine translocase TatA/TatE family subunit [Anaerolineales bacterium]
MDIGAPELIIILVIIVLLFGVGRIGAIAGEMGKAVREFRNGLSGKDEGTPESKPAESKPADPESDPAKK